MATAEKAIWFQDSRGQLDALLAAYPDARFVMTHRDPVKATASACSLARSLTSAFSDSDHDGYIAEHWPDTVVAMFDRLVDFRERHPEAQFVDVPYQDLITDPLGVVQRIYDEFGLALASTTKASMCGHIEREKQHRHGKHAYSLNDFGLERRQLESRFAKYLGRFQVTIEAT